MLFVGSGALLARAVVHSKRTGLAVDAVCCPPGDFCIRLSSLGIFVVESDDPDIDMFPLFGMCSDGTAFSINNRHILGDLLLDSDVSFFNVHNGLVQRYRGIPEVCIFSAICEGAAHYGATLHKLLPNQKVDTGPVVSQLGFDISGADTFSDVMSRSLNSCQQIFEVNVQRICSGSYSVASVETCRRAYSYKDVPEICKLTSAARRAKACDFRQYAAHFPKLKELAESCSWADPVPRPDSSAV